MLFLFSLYNPILVVEEDGEDVTAAAADVDSYVSHGQLGAHQATQFYPVGHLKQINLLSAKNFWN